MIEPIETWNNYLPSLITQLRDKINELHVVSKDGQQRTEALVILKRIEEICVTKYLPEAGE